MERQAEGESSSCRELITMPPESSFTLGSSEVEGAPTVNSPIIKRSVIVRGHKTSISLEDPFWAEIRTIASDKKIKISDLVTEIDLDRNGANLSSALRVFVLTHYRRHSRTAEWPEGAAGLSNSESK